MMLKMLHDTKSHSLVGISVRASFSRVSPGLAQDICKTAKLSPNAQPRDLHGAAAETLYKAIQSTKIMAPPSNCLSPIGERAILHGLYKQIKGEFYTAVTRPPAVYRGNPFVIEAGLAFGKDRNKRQKLNSQTSARRRRDRDDDNELARVIRYANRVPLLYQQSACATFKAVLDTSWRNYGVAQSRGALPAGPMVIFVHMASVWVPFTSESKEAIADYDEIRKEIKLALAGVRPAAGSLFATAGTGRGRVSPAQHLRALHRGSGRRLQPAERRQTRQRKTQRTAAEDRDQAHRRQEDRRDPRP